MINKMYYIGNKLKTKMHFLITTTDCKITNFTTGRFSKAVHSYNFFISSDKKTKFGIFIYDINRN